MASKKAAPQTATNVAVGLAAHMAIQAATLQPKSKASPPSSLTENNVSQMDVDEVSDQEWETRVQQWRSQTQAAPETEGELEGGAKSEGITSADPSTTNIGYFLYVNFGVTPFHLGVNIGRTPCFGGRRVSYSSFIVLLLG